MKQIPYHQSTLAADDIRVITDLLQNKSLGHGHYTDQCQAWLSQHHDAKVLLTHSCTAALEMAAILAGVQPGDEIIMPSFTFVSTASAFVLRGATPVFIDSDPETLNIDVAAIEAAITPKTKAIVPVHYAAIGCDMPAIRSLAGQHNLLVIEDAAQCLWAYRDNQPLGGIGDMGSLSFHNTKNITAGQGGALILNNETFYDRAQILLQKGTNRAKFLQGLVDKYTWVDIGSSYTMSELNAALLWSQLQKSEQITQSRQAIWQRYYEGLAGLEALDIRRPTVPNNCQHNAHIFYLLLPNAKMREPLMQALKQKGIAAVFHYVPLHLSPAGKHYGRPHGNQKNAESFSQRLIRLPLWPGLEPDVDYIIEQVLEACKTLQIKSHKCNLV